MRPPPPSPLPLPLPLSLSLLLLFLFFSFPLLSLSLTVGPRNDSSTFGTFADLVLIDADPSAIYLITALPSGTPSSSIFTPFPVTALVNTSLFTLSPLIPNTPYKVIATPYNPTGYGTSSSDTLKTASATPTILSAYLSGTQSSNYTVTLILSAAGDTLSIPTATFSSPETPAEVVTWGAGGMSLQLSVDVMTADGVGSAVVTVVNMRGAEDPETAGSSTVFSVTSPPITGYEGSPDGRVIYFNSALVSTDSTRTQLLSFVPAMQGIALPLSFLQFSGSTDNVTFTVKVSVTSTVTSLSSSLSSVTSCGSFSRCLQVQYMGQGEGVVDGVLTSLLSSISLTASAPGDVVVRVLSTSSTKALTEDDYFVVRVDGPPVIQSTISTLSIPLSSNFYSFSNWGFQLLSSAPTQQTAPTLLTVTVSDGGNLSIPAYPSTLQCIPYCFTTSQSFLLYDTLPNLNVVLNQMNVKQTFPDVAGPLFISMTYDDQSMSGFYPLHHVVSFYAPLIMSCPTQQYVSQITSASLSSSLNSIVVVLSEAVDPQWTSLPSSASLLDCSNFLASSSLKLLTHASCHFPSPRSFAVVLGFDSQWQVGDGLSFLPTAFGLCFTWTTQGTGVKYPTISVSSDTATPPLMSIIAPQQVVHCTTCSNDFVYLTAIPQSNVARLPSFKWQVSPPIGPLPSIYSQQLSVPLNQLNQTTTYTFTLFMNYLGTNVSAAVHNLTVTSEVEMILLPYQPDNSTILSSQPLSLGVAVNFTALASETTKTTPVSFSWQCITVAGTVVPSSTWAGVNSPNLYIPPYNLTAGNTYNCTVTASQDLGSTIKSFPAQQSFFVNVLAGEVYAIINGGDQRNISTDQPLFLDGSLSFDANAISTTSSTSYSYLWSCTAAGGMPCMSRTSGAELQVSGNSSSSWFIGAGGLYPNVYVFTLVYADVNDNDRSSQAQVQVVVSGQSPQAVISTVPLDRLTSFATPAGSAGSGIAPADIANVQRPAGGRIINSGDQLVLFASSIDNSPSLSYYWTVTGGPQLPSSGLVGTNSSLFVINALNDEFYFTPGYNYTFTVTVSSPLYFASGQSSMTFYINRPPVCDSFAINPSSGVAFSAQVSPFLYSFSPYDPDENRALALMTYQIYRIDVSSLLQVDLTGEVGQTRGNLGALPTGDPSNAFQITVGVRAWDRYRAQSLTSVTVVSSPPSGGLTLAVLESYYVSVDSISRDDTLTLMVATSNVMSALASDYVDTIAIASSPPLLNFVQFYNTYAPMKKYMVERILDKEDSVRAAVLVDFLAVVMADYSTLDQVTVVSILNTLQGLMVAPDAELWNDIAGDPHVLQSVVYIIQQSFHATSMAYITGLTNVTVNVQPPYGTISYPLSDPSLNTTTAEDMFAATNTALSTLLSHLSDLILLPGDVLGLNYNRSLSGVIGKADLMSNPLKTSLSYSSAYWGSEISIKSNAFSELMNDSSAILSMTLLQLDGWGDHISFDIFPTFYVNIQSEDPDLPFPSEYPNGTVQLIIGYEQRACDDGWVNAGQFRLQAGTPPPSPPHCYLSCAAFDPSNATFSNTSAQVRTISIDEDNQVVVCEIYGPGLYTILKDDLYVPPPNSSLSVGIVTAVTTLIGVPQSLVNTLTAQVTADISFLLDIPPTRVGSVTNSPQGSGNWQVQFALLGATMASTQSSYDLMDTLRTLGFLTTSHTFAYRLAQMSSIRCLDSSGNLVTGSNCDPGSGSGGVTPIEIIAIAVVVGFFGTLCCGVLLFFCCRQMKYWWDRHEFRQPSLEDDTEMTGVGAGGQLGGAKSARERAEESRRRRSNRVSWYNKDVETAAAYTYNSRNSRPSMSNSGSAKSPAFRVRSDSRGSEDGDLQLDDVQIVGGGDDVNVEDLAEIGLVLDGVDDGGEDSYVMDGHKVKAVKQVRELDGEELSIDDSAMSRSRGSSLGSREYSQSGASRVSLSGNDDGPLALSYPRQDDEPSVNRSEVEPTTPTTPKTPGSKAFLYKK